MKTHVGYTSSQWIALTCVTAIGLITFYNTNTRVSAEARSLVIGALISLAANLFVGGFQSNKSSQQLEVSTDRLKAATDQLNTNVETLFTSQSEQTARGHGVLQNLVSRIEQQVSNLEDASRRILEGFPKIFRQAELMLEGERLLELDVLTFTPYFGGIHIYNEMMLQKFHELTGGTANTFKEQAPRVRGNLADRAKNFQRKLSSLAMQEQDQVRFRLVTFKEEELRQQFLEPLRKKLPPTEASSIIQQMVEKHNACVCGIEANYAANTTVEYVKRMPLQMFIAKYGKEQDSRDVVPYEKRSCLVFFIGTDTADQGERAGGFYTELPNLINLFVDVFGSIVAANKLDGATTENPT